MQALPIFLDRLANPVAAVLISITVVLIFGRLSCQSCRAKGFGERHGTHAQGPIEELVSIESMCQFLTLAPDCKSFPRELR